MDKTVGELMRPRYKVIAGYPASHLYFNIDDILEWDGQSYKRKENISMAKETVESYPHLFRKLEWWEDRQKEDMPQFVKSKFACWVNDTRYEEGQIVKIISINRLANDDLSFFLPSTEQEYNDYIKSKELK